MTSATILGGIAGTTLTADEAAFFREADPWGFILFGRNVESPDQLRALTAALRDAVGREAVITVDQEGGRVQRLRAPHWRNWPAPLTQADAGPRAMWLRYHLMGQELRAVGIDSNCAPTLDVAQDATHPFLLDRCLGSDPAVIAGLGRAAAQGLLDAGVLPVVKHMPGHGRAQADSHHDLPVVDADADDLSGLDFAPFRALADLPMGMTAHIRFTALDDRPATSSAKVVDLIRRDIGFDGLLLTDDITMNALPGSHADRARASIEAGCDIVLHCNGDVAQMTPVVEAAGPMGPDARRRADAALALRHAPQRADIPALLAEWQSLTGAIA
ncbi:beta-N-acetylhexosaminidase [Paracoccus sp. 1_MG-2023]|uniref:beta-N-acetylhexosaminidase n=1 Tax=unclassified Paracoccus (in: a-proteobacteria) TaxID=2688777 RepID=UPI001C0899DA|nr:MULTISPECIES: beta-N-acetylhexosaminidase [unclassified Paracoccus (in: a-proteobacteria)]MBU2956455.1 beta-N-acetylhexosaminidase [Paracoccus sp. C2R09]MDO6669741.1 beta-N-acetylhexosaminidase [Paracoccus sp. 1_MG-2023]